MKIVLIFIACLSHSSWGALIRDQFEGIRQMGMGNAAIALADDANTLYYNPAGLARFKSVHTSVLDFELGIDALTTFTRVLSASGGGGTQLLGNSRQFVRFGMSPTFVAPYFGFGVYARSSTMLELQGLQLPDVDISSRTDVGGIIGVGIPIGDYISGGVSVRAFARAGMEATITPADLLGQLGVELTDFESNIFDFLSSLAGVGWAMGLNFGVLIKVPLFKKTPEVRIAGTWEDFGYTTFRSLSLFSAGSAPPRILPTRNAGLAVIYDLSKRRRKKIQLAVTFEMRRIFKVAQPLFKKLNFGTELKIPGFGFRAGVHQADWTAGFSFDAFPHTRLHLATYAYELDDNVRSRLARIYLLQMTIGFDPL